MNSELISSLLPEVYQRVNHKGSPLNAALEAMVELLSPAEEVLENLDANFSVDQCHDQQLLMLAHWTNLDRLFKSSGEGPESPWLPRQLDIEPGHLRNLIANAARLSRRRGTEEGLLEFLRIATGLNGFSLESVTEAGEREPTSFHICVFAPKEAWAQQELIEGIIEQEKPAYVTYQIIYDRVTEEFPQPVNPKEGDQQ